MNNVLTLDHPNALTSMPISCRNDPGSLTNSLAKEETWDCATASLGTFKPGEKVTVYRVPVLSRPFIEGRATVLEPIAYMPDLYRVRFENERRSRRRLVHPGDWQSDPDRLLAALRGHWRATSNPALLAEF